MAMRIRELAAQTGTTTRTLRYYEAQGLLPTGRSANGYRVYDGHHVRLVREIRSLQAVGFSLEDVRPFVECLLAGHESGDDCPASVDMYRRKLAYLERHIAELRDARDRLSERLANLGDLAARRLPCANCCHLATKATPERGTMSNAETTSTVIEVTDDTFQDLVLSSSLGKAVLVDFWAQWCPPCHMLSPVLEEIAAELSDKLIVAKVNVDENQVTAQRYGILAMPTLSVFRNGEVISQVVGARPKRRLLADLSLLLSPAFPVRFCLPWPAAGRGPSSAGRRCRSRS